MDTYQLQYHYKARLSKLEPYVTLKLERVYKYDKVYGMTVHAPHISPERYRTENPESTQPWDDCLVNYIDWNKPWKYEMEQFYKEKLKDEVRAYIVYGEE